MMVLLFTVGLIIGIGIIIIMAIKPLTSRSTPRDVYLHLLGTLTLFISVISLLTVIFQYINILLPDPLNFFRQGVLDTIRGASSSLIVSFPIFLWMSSLIYHDMVDAPEKHNLGIRKWLTYFTLLVAAVAMIIYLIMLVNGLYGGELSLSFTLKVLSVFIIAGLIFGYYLWDVRQEKIVGSLSKQLAWGLSFLVVIILVAGIFIAGTPTQQRRIRFDTQRINDLQTIQGQIVQTWISKAKLPTSTAQLSDSISGFVAPVDPETQQAYEYRVLETYSFELCATFSAIGDSNTSFGPSEQTKAIMATDSFGLPLTTDLEGTWKHGVGRACFERTIDPERYKPQTKTPTS
jgi:hypothetical protein